MNDILSIKLENNSYACEFSLIIFRIPPGLYVDFGDGFVVVVGISVVLKLVDS